MVGTLRFAYDLIQFSNSSVIASKAKQSTLEVGLGCFVAEPVIGPRVRADPLAPRNDERPRSRGTKCPSDASFIALAK
jgi:hypothetical protein